MSPPVGVTGRDRDAHMRLLAWCIEQLGGSVALDAVEQDRVFDSMTYSQLQSYKLNTGVLIVKVVKSEEQRDFRDGGFVRRNQEG